MAIMLDRIRWPGHVARMGGLRIAKESYGARSLERHRRRAKNNIK
jgi:hypothetical protein